MAEPRKPDGVQQPDGGVPDDAAAAPAPQAKKKRRWWASIGLGHVATLACGVYLWRGGQGLYTIMNPLDGLPPDSFEPPLLPLWPQGARLRLVAFISKQQHAVCAPEKGATQVWEQGFALSSTAAAESVSLWLHRNGTEAAAPEGATAVALPKGVMKRLQRNEAEGPPVFLHVCVSRSGDEGATGGSEVVTTTASLTKPGPKPRALQKRWLLQDVGLGHWSGVSSWPDLEAVDPHRNATTVPLWKPEIHVHVIADETAFPTRMHVPQIHPYLSVRHAGPSGTSVRPFAGSVPRYLPPMYVSEMGVTSDQYLALNSSVSGLPLKLEVEPTHLTRWLVLNHFEQTLGMQQEAMGLGDSDMDEVRQLIVGTSVWLLTVTIVASVLHLLFEFLAMKSDVNFWRKNKSLTGLSVRSLFIDLFFQIVILLFLIEEDSSLLITVPSGVSILIQFWKCQRATGLRVSLHRGKPVFRCVRWEEESQGKGQEAEIANLSLDIDRKAIRAMCTGVVPLCVAYCAHSLVRFQHRTWYAWLIDSMTSSVYAFGFILMTPQLFINYKLKTVAHLPWRFLSYRFINTFIDDLFAFIIRMPTMHRLSCFRDDIVFIIYLGQRRWYPVDYSRVAGIDDDN